MLPDDYCQGYPRITVSYVQVSVFHWKISPKRLNMQAVDRQINCSFFAKRKQGRRIVIHGWHTRVPSCPWRNAIPSRSHVVRPSGDTHRPPEELVTRAEEDICQTGTSPENLVSCAPWWFSTRPVVGWSPLAQWGTRFQWSLAAGNTLAYVSSVCTYCKTIQPNCYGNISDGDTLKCIFHLMQELPVNSSCTISH